MQHSETEQSAFPIETDGLPDVNRGDLEATVHWHGLRLEIQCPDPGAFWYHPHIREDYGQELGLYGMFSFTVT